MCGIAGIVNLSTNRTAPAGALRKMADAIFHRGPDEDGYFENDQLAFANRRLSIVGLEDGRQPLFNEDQSVAVVYNGELFNYPELRDMLKGRGHQLHTHCDTEVIPHLWEDHHEELFPYLKGQFAFAVWDEKQRTLLLARDRFGICPLFWARQRYNGDEWLLFASEIKAILASGMVKPRPDVRGIHQIFNFFAIPGEPTCFEGIELLQPGHFLRFQFDGDNSLENYAKRKYWEIDFPNQGDEEDGQDPKKLVDEFEKVFLGAVERRLRVADVPVVSYLSGGIDSSLVVAMATKVLGRTIPTFTIRIKEPSLDETDQAAVVSRHVGGESVVVDCGDLEVLNEYPRLVWAAECPVVDTSCTALMLLAQEVHRQNFKVALTGEGADEWFAGYSWYKFHRVLRCLNRIPGANWGDSLRQFYLTKFVGASRDYWRYTKKILPEIAGRTAFQEIYGLMSTSRFRFFSDSMNERLGDQNPYEDVNFNYDRVKQWHPLNRALYWGGKIHLPGHLLSMKGDRIAMHSAVEMRYPFLDEEVFEFVAKIAPRWKLRGFTEKYLLRLLGERWLPRSTAWAPKGMFRAPLDSFFPDNPPAYVDQLLSPESLAKTGYFNATEVALWRNKFRTFRPNMYKRISIELGLVGVVATQLWHHIFIDNSLCELPDASSPESFATIMPRAAPLSARN